MEAPHHLKSFATGVGQMQRGRGRWVRPAVSRLAAGSAEDGNNNIPDGGQPS